MMRSEETAGRLVGVYRLLYFSQAQVVNILAPIWYLVLSGSCSSVLTLPSTYFLSISLRFTPPRRNTFKSLLPPSSLHFSNQSASPLHSSVFPRYQHHVIFPYLTARRRQHPSTRSSFTRFLSRRNSLGFPPVRLWLLPQNCHS